MKMEIKITEKRENGLLNRTEVSGSVSFDGPTPSNTDLAAEIAKQLKTDVSLVVMKHIYIKFGHQAGEFFTLVYKDEVARNKIERMTKHMKKRIEEAGKTKEKEAKKAEEVKTEKPKEESAAPEEKKEEAKQKADEPKEEDKKEEASE